MKRGFTLIEAMIVVAIFGVLTASALLDAFVLWRQPGRMMWRVEHSTADAEALSLLQSDIRAALGRENGDDARHLTLKYSDGTIEYEGGRGRPLLRFERRGRRSSARALLPYPLEEASFLSALPAGRTGAGGVTVRLKGGRGMLAQGATIVAGWRGEQP